MKENNAETRIVNNDFNGLNTESENTIAQNNVFTNNAEQDTLDYLLKDTHVEEAPVKKVSVGKKVASAVGVGVVGAASAGAGAYAFGHDFGGDAGEEHVEENENAAFVAEESTEQVENIHDILTGEESDEELISGEESDEDVEIAEESVVAADDEASDLDDEASDLDDEASDLDVAETTSGNIIDNLSEQVESEAVAVDNVVEEAVVDVEQIVEEVVVSAEDATEEVLENAANEVVDAVNVVSEQVVDEAMVNAEQVIDEAMVNAEQVVDEAMANAEQVVDEAMVNAEQVVDEAMANAEQVVDEAMANAEQVVDEAMVNAEQVVDEAMANAEQPVEEFVLEGEESDLDVVESTYDSVNVSLAHVDTTDMSFNEAFAAARAEVGSNGVFEWRGGYYGTYLSNEWAEMPEEFKQEFGSHNWAEEFNSGNDVVAFGAEDMGIEIDGESISLAHVDTTDMSFNEAFAAARAEVGSNGVFEWHGGYYGTYHSDEWAEKSDEFKQAFGSHDWASEFETESIAMAEVEVELDDDLGCDYYEEEDLGRGNFEEADLGCANVECVADSIDSLEQSFLLDDGVIVADVLDEMTGDLPGEILAGNFEVEVAIEDVSFDVQVEDDLYAMDPSLNGVDDLGTDDILAGIDMDSDMMC